MKSNHNNFSKDPKRLCKIVLSTFEINWVYQEIYLKVLSICLVIGKKQKKKGGVLLVKFFYYEFLKSKRVHVLGAEF